MNTSRVLLVAGIAFSAAGAVLMVLGAMVLVGSFMDMDPPYELTVWPLLVACGVTAVGGAMAWFGRRHGEAS